MSIPNHIDSVTILNGVMAILILDLFWATGLRSHLASQKIDFAMLVLRELCKRYLPACFGLVFYTAAFRKIQRESAAVRSSPTNLVSGAGLPSVNEKQIKSAKNCDNLWECMESMSTSLDPDWMSSDMSSVAADLPWGLEFPAFTDQDFFPYGPPDV